MEIRVLVIFFKHALLVSLKQQIELLAALRTHERAE
jgi:hypothetical protein